MILKIKIILCQILKFYNQINVFVEPCRTKGDIVIEHGETTNLEPCLSCICLNGVVKCDKVDEQKCPVLKCEVSEQFSVPDQCCKFCPGTKILTARF